MVLHVKPYEQSRGHCGPASLKMELGYFGVEQSERRLAQLSGSTNWHVSPSIVLLVISSVPEL